MIVVEDGFMLDVRFEGVRDFLVVLVCFRLFCFLRGGQLFIALTLFPFISIFFLNSHCY